MAGKPRRALPAIILYFNRVKYPSPFHKGLVTIISRIADSSKLVFSIQESATSKYEQCVIKINMYYNIITSNHVNEFLIRLTTSSKNCRVAFLAPNKNFGVTVDWLIRRSLAPLAHQYPGMPCYSNHFLFIPRKEL